jgi:hypothetical protein
VILAIGLTASWTDASLLIKAMGHLCALSMRPPHHSVPRRLLIDANPLVLSGHDFFAWFEAVTSCAKTA